ncbi:hypothetical protein [Myxococcus landrumensis]|uniref:Virion structural protein n=1 Tax=Myxococcus landrumensis TaxID=2813577 RepID=A0ABX7N6F0_9BACT|nr:hypothetical protein [Myxococcus landrumus]QSQ14046.1 hypothetical protein JY572_37990 [Myxococcus landrumus]
MPLTDATRLYNLIASEYGLRVRLGWREWVTGLTGLVDNEVRSELPFTGAQANGAGDRLFVTTSTGIWDASASTVTPTQVVTFPTQTGQAGYGVSTVFVAAGGHYLLYTDEENGLYRYEESSATWTKVTMGGATGQIAGVDPANFVHVAVFKGRAWFTQRNTARAWYLPAGAIAGTATLFEVAQRFKAGGPLVGLWNWTYDGGAGVDDALVGVSGGGDVVIYKGTDPASATTFGLHGVWSLGGPPPAGRRIATDTGGDLLLLSPLGILPLSRLVAGEVDKDTYVTAKVANRFSFLMASRATLPGWSLRIHPEDNALVVTYPTYTGQPTEQLVMALAGRSWSRYRDLPMFSTEVWGGKFYFGTTDGRVLINDGYVDGVTLADPNTYMPVQWSALTAFHLRDGRTKQVQLLRPVMLSDSAAPALEVQALYDFNMTELPPVSASGADGSVWDGGIWDQAVWAGEYSALQQAAGASGIGFAVAVGIRGTATARTIWVGTDVTYTTGGVL